MDEDTRNGLDGIAVGFFTLTLPQTMGAPSPRFPVGIGGINELHAAFLTESRTRNAGWGRAVGNPGSLNPFFGFKGGIRECLIEIRGSHPSQKTRRTPDSCHAALDKTACAPFYKERRMNFAEPSKLNRNPGIWGTRRFVALFRKRALRKEIADGHAP